MQTNPPTILLQTAQSALLEHNVDANLMQLVAQCVDVLEADSLLDANPEIVIYGKICHQRRHVGFFSDEAVGYHYSTTTTSAKPMPPPLRELLARVNTLFQNVDTTVQPPYNGILINKYVDGSDTIGRHSDDERTLARDAGVVSLSYGAPRIFRVRCKASGGKKVLDVVTRPDKMLQMVGNFQREFTHEIPVEKKVKEPRWSFTFRKHTAHR